MDNQMRREKLYEMLENAEEPLTGVVLSKALNVTRQIIVSDVALLRSSGKKIISTARGVSAGRRSTGKRVPSGNPLPEPDHG